MKMQALLLLCCFLLAATEYLLGSAHMIPEESLSTSRVAVTKAPSETHDVSPPVLIVELPRSQRKNRKKKKQKKNKLNPKRRPPPPANCIPLWGSCKSSSSVCCDFCAFCQCRLFKTVCFCRMGNPRC